MRAPPDEAAKQAAADKRETQLNESLPHRARAEHEHGDTYDPKMHMPGYQPGPEAERVGSVMGRLRGMGPRALAWAHEIMGDPAYVGEDAPAAWREKYYAMLDRIAKHNWAKCKHWLGGNTFYTAATGRDSGRYVVPADSAAWRVVVAAHVAFVVPAASSLNGTRFYTLGYSFFFLCSQSYCYVMLGLSCYVNGMYQTHSIFFLHSCITAAVVQCNYI